MTLLERLVARVVPAAWRESILADLVELRARRAERDGPAAADRWYRGQLRRLVVRFAADGLRRRWRGQPNDPRFEPGPGRPEPLRELRLAARSLWRAPAFALPAVGILGLTLGAAATLFTVIDGVLREPLPLPDSHELVLLCEDHATLAGMCIGSVGSTRDLVDASPFLSAGGTARGWSASLEDGSGRTGLSLGLLDPGALEALGFAPLHGRLFRPDEIGADRDDVLLLTHGLWVRRYGGDPAAVGRVVRLDGDPVTIVGVLPPDFVMPMRPGIDAWRPVHVHPTDSEAHAWRGFMAIARLAPGASIRDARDDLAGRYARSATTIEAIDDEWRLSVRGALDELVADVRGPLRVLFGGVLVLLLIGCVNVAHLMFARTAVRAREFRVRAALGAGRGGLVRLVVMESAWIGLGAAALATALAHLGVTLVVRLAPPGLPRLDNVALDGSTVAFAGLAAALAVLAFGAAPALLATRPGAGSGLGRSFTADRRAARAHRILVAAELSLSTALLFGGLVLGRTLSAWSRWDPGFDRDGVAVLSLIASTGAHPDRERVADLWRQVEAEIAAIPGVTAVGTASAVPLRGGRETTAWQAEGLDADASPRVARWYDVGPGYFGTLGIPLLAGREIDETDRSDTEAVAVVNRTLAERAWPDGNAVDRWVEVAEGPFGSPLRLRVVGVVEDVPPVTPGTPPEPEIYWSNRQAPRWGTLVVIRTGPTGIGLPTRVRGRLGALDPTLSIGSLTSLEDLFRRPLATPRFHSTLAAMLAALALLLAALGVYATLTWEVARARRTIGLRLALGATGRREAGRLIAGAGRTALLGVGVGVVLSYWGSRFLASLVQGVSASDGLSLGMAAGITLVLAPTAAWLAARRAAAVDPADLLRAD